MTILGAGFATLPAAASGESIAELQHALAAGQTTCRQVVDGTLARIAASEQPEGINAAIEVNPEAPLEDR